MIRTYIFLLCTILFFGSPCLADNKGTETFQALKKEYLHLRNTDSHIVKEQEWRLLASALEQFAKGDKANAPQALFDASKMHRSIYEEKGSEEDLVKAKELLQTIVRNYPSSPHAPESLKELSDLTLTFNKDEEESAQYLREIVSKFPKSDYYDFARRRLDALSSNGGEDQSNKQPSLRDGPVIALDPGHGGEDFGAVGVSGLLEKDVVLDVALKLQRILEENLGARVLLTRSKDTFVPLQRRMEMANEAQADLFVSIHANSSETGTARGFEIYVLDNTNDKASQTLSERENASGGEIDDISFMISDLIQSSKSPQSFALAQEVKNSFATFMPKRWGDIKILQVKKAPFYVLVGAHMPAVLAELFFINEAKDGAHLAEEAFRGDLAQALYEGIHRYLEHRS